MAGPVQTISYFSRRLIQFEQKFAQRPAESLRATAAVFRTFSEHLAGALECLEAGADPESFCAELRALMPGLQTETLAEIGSPEADKILYALGDALEPGRLREQMETSENTAVLFEELYKASILVRALADGLHAAG
jgi:hypothetical protein